MQRVGPVWNLIQTNQLICLRQTGNLKYGVGPRLLKKTLWEFNVRHYINM